MPQNPLFTALQPVGNVGTPRVGAPNATTTQRRLAEALIRAGSSGAPVQHPLQALNRALQGGLGGFQLSQARKDEETQRQADLQRQQATQAQASQQQQFTNDLATRRLDQQASQFDQTFGLNQANVQSQIAERNRKNRPFDPSGPTAQFSPGPFKDFSSKKKFEQDLRKEFTTQAKDFQKVRDAHSRVQASGQDPSAAGDLALIFNYMKTLDPGSTVREGEFATAAMSTGLLDRNTIGIYNNVIRGTRLTPTQRQDFLKRADLLFERQKIQHGQRVSEFSRLAEGSGLNPNDVVIDLGQAKTPKAKALLSQAKKAIEAGADPQAVAQRLQENGVDPSGLQ